MSKIAKNFNQLVKKKLASPKASPEIQPGQEWRWTGSNGQYSIWLMIDETDHAKEPSATYQVWNAECIESSYNRYESKGKFDDEAGDIVGSIEEVWIFPGETWTREFWYEVQL